MENFPSISRLNLENVVCFYITLQQIKCKSNPFMDECIEQANQIIQYRVLCFLRFPVSLN